MLQQYEYDISEMSPSIIIPEDFKWRLAMILGYISGQFC